MPASGRHETDMPKYLGDVRCWVNSGKHMLASQNGAFDPGRVETFFVPPKTASNRARWTSTRPSEPIFAVSSLESIRAQTSGHAERPERSHGAHNLTRSSSPDRGQEWFDTDDVHHAREVVGEHVQRHFSRYLRQRLHQKVRRTHPHLQRGERMLDGFAAHTHGLRVLIEPRLRG